jgi:hypothetical protein
MMTAIAAKINGKEFKTSQTKKGELLAKSKKHRENYQEG